MACGECVAPDRDPGGDPDEPTCAAAPRRSLSHLRATGQNTTFWASVRLINQSPLAPAQVVGDASHPASPSFRPHRGEKVASSFINAKTRWLASVVRCASAHARAGRSRRVARDGTPHAKPTEPKLWPLLRLHDCFARWCLARAFSASWLVGGDRMILPLPPSLHLPAAIRWRRRVREHNRSSRPSLAELIRFTRAFGTDRGYPTLSLSLLPVLHRPFGRLVLCLQGYVKISGRGSRSGLDFCCSL